MWHPVSSLLAAAKVKPKSPVTVKWRLPFRGQEWESLRARMRWKSPRRERRSALCRPTAKQWGFSSSYLHTVHPFKSYNMNTVLICNFQPTRHVPADVVRIWCQQYRDHCKVTDNILKHKSYFELSGTSCWQHQRNQMDQNLSHECLKVKPWNGINFENMFVELFLVSMH